MSLNKLVTWITFLAVFAMAAKVSVDNDTWWHLRSGQWIVHNRAVPQTDPFSYTRQGEAWQYPGWLVEVPMYWIYQALGPGGLNLWTALMVTLAFVFVWQTLSGGVFLRAFVTVLAAAASGVYWAARPYLATFLLAAVFLWILEDHRWRRSPAAERRLWLLPLLMILWANSHGGFAVGFILVGVYWFSEALIWLHQNIIIKSQSRTYRSLSAYKNPFMRLTLIGFLMVFAVCINPSGPVMLAYPFQTVEIGALQEYIQEWQSPDFHMTSLQPFIWLLLSTLAAVGVSRRRLALTDFFLAAGFTYMSFLAVRNVALFALASPAVLTRHAAPVMAATARKLGFRGASSAPPRRVQVLLNWSLFGVLVLAVLIKAAVDFPISANEAVFREKFPKDAVTFIKERQLPGRIFNSYNWGAYLLWELPEYPVFLDGRTDLYDDEVIDEWLQVARAETGWQEVLDRWDVHLLLLEPGVPVVGHLVDQGWKLLYSDAVAVVYGK